MSNLNECLQIMIWIWCVMHASVGSARERDEMTTIKCAVCFLELCTFLMGARTHTHTHINAHRLCQQFRVLCIHLSLTWALLKWQTTWMGLGDLQVVISSFVRSFVFFSLLFASSTKWTHFGVSLNIKDENDFFHSNNEPTKANETNRAKWFCVWEKQFSVPYGTKGNRLSYQPMRCPTIFRQHPAWKYEEKKIQQRWAEKYEQNK